MSNLVNMIITCRVYQCYRLKLAFISCLHSCVLQGTLWYTLHQSIHCVSAVCVLLNVVNRLSYPVPRSIGETSSGILEPTALSFTITELIYTPSSSMLGPSSVLYQSELTPSPTVTQLSGYSLPVTNGVSFVTQQGSTTVLVMPTLSTAATTEPSGTSPTASLSIQIRTSYHASLISQSKATPTVSDHTTLLSYVSAVRSGTETSFTPPSKLLPTHTHIYTSLTSVKTNIGESSTPLYQLESTTVALPQTRHTQLHTPLASTSVAASSIHYNQSELVTTLTQTDSVELFHSSPASMQASRLSPLLSQTATLTHTASTRLLFTSPSSSNAAGWKQEPLSQSTVIGVSVTTVLAFAGIAVLVASIIITW